VSTSLIGKSQYQATDDGQVTHRGPLWLWVLVTVGLVAAFGYLRLELYPDRFVPLTNVLALLVCLWHRNLRLLWGMVTAFATMVIYKASVLIPYGELPGAQEWLFGGMQLVNILGAAFVIDRAIRLAIRVDATMAHLEASNAELDASNEELAAREEEITQQNEELQLQAEELEQQTEELSAQTEELQALNEELADRETTLRDLLSTTAQGLDADETLSKLGESIQKLLGDRVAAAAILLRTDDNLLLQPMFGLSPERDLITGHASLAALVLSRNRAGALADTNARPDIEVPTLASGQPVRSLASAPLGQAVDEPAGGVLEVYSAEPGEWSEDDLRVLQWFAEQCGRMLTIAEMRADRETLLQAERLARAEADRANQAKDEFVAMLSHELRTPLHAMLGWATVLRKGEGSPEDLAKGLEVIERNARQQGQLISDLLDINRIVTGKLYLDVAPVDLPSIVERTVESMREPMATKRLRLEWHVGVLSRQIMGDPTRLQQISWNLLSNAVKFARPDGLVRIEITEHASHAEFSVIDDGEGIDPAHLPHLFERYRQADPSSTRRHGGLGLGLAIVKDLVQLHGGSVEAHSEGVGKGSTFKVRLPMGASALPEARHVTFPETAWSEPTGSEVLALAGLTILVVDDEGDARRLVRHILAAHGAVVHEADCGDAALKLLGEVGFDVLVSDIAMPGMDGHTLIRLARDWAAKANRKAPAALALTAFARAEDRTRTLLAGYQAHLSKPVEPAELVAAVARLSPRATTG
jgi:signal transduction histidine kinase/ActR/RegA family two-component response regulator